MFGRLFASGARELSDLVQSLADGAALFDGDDRLILANAVLPALHPALGAAGILRPGVYLDSIVNALVAGDELAGAYGAAGELIAIRRGAREKGRDESEIAYRDGRWVRICDYRLSGGRVLSIHTDVTLAKRRERLITQSEARFRAIFATTLDAVVILDERGMIEVANPAAERLFGRSAVKLIGESVGSLIPDAAANAADFLAEAGSGGRRETAGRRDGGDPSMLELTVAPWSFEGQRRYTVVMRDVTEARRQEQELRDGRERLRRNVAELEATQARLREQAGELVRLADQYQLKSEETEAANRAKSEFLASISHELRTPLNGILGAVGLFRSTELTAEQRRFADTIRVSGDNLLLLINDLIDYSALETGRIHIEPVDFDVADLIDDILTMFRSPATRKGLTLGREVAGGMVTTLHADAARIRQILFHLVGNAVKFTEHGGITVSAEASARGRDVELKLSVRDTGIGIPPAAQASLFEHFTQADSSSTRRYGGTGLGLAVCRRLVALLGGQIGVDSVPERGSLFWFTVVCRMGHSAPSRPPVGGDAVAPKPVPSARHLALRILVAEDNPVNQMVINGMLDQMGYKADLVGNGAEAVDAAMRVPYDIVLMDVQMPEMDGIAATQAIRRLSGPVASVPIVALTAAATSENHHEYIAAGMTDVVAKPIAFEALSQAIARCLGEAAAQPITPAAAPSRQQSASLSGFDAAAAAEIDRLLADINRVAAAEPATPADGGLDDAAISEMDALLAQINAVARGD